MARSTCYAQCRSIRRNKDTSCHVDSREQLLRRNRLVRARSERRSNSINIPNLESRHAHWWISNLGVRGLLCCDHKSTIANWLEPEVEDLKRATLLPFFCF